jgi:hypothetical protein
VTARHSWPRSSTTSPSKSSLKSPGKHGQADPGFRGSLARLVSDRITYRPDGTALVADRAVILGSMMQVTAERAATGLSLHRGAAPAPL